MNRYLIALTALLILAFSTCIPALAQDSQSDQPAASITDTTNSTSVDTTTTNTSDGTTAKDKDKDKEEKDRKEKEKLEYKARAEAERRERVEDKQRRQEHYNLNSHTYESSSIGLGFMGNPMERSSISLLVAPSGRIEKTAIGLQWIGKQKFGIALWGSGDADEDDDVIDAPIPHDDYHTDTSKSCFSLEGLYCMGTERSMLILGVGIAVEETIYTDVSNVTGWKWKGGDDYSTRPAAQIGYRALISQRIGIQFGYDTSQYGYFGLSASF
ncbi:hypothetical protein LLG46_02580 [bacterium]|nr:hypothetical protein [bacterium]